MLGAKGFDSQFTGNADTAVFVILEEINLNSSAATPEEIKKRIDADFVNSERKGKDAHVARNFTHYVQTMNDLEYAPITRGDTRIVVWEVPELTDKVPNMSQLLEVEAPAIRHKLEMTTIPIEHSGRLFLPPLMTDEKQLLLSNFSEIPKWLTELAYTRGVRNQTAAEIQYMLGGKPSYQRIGKTLSCPTIQREVKSMGFAIHTGETTNDHRNKRTTYTIEKL